MAKLTKRQKSSIEMVAIYYSMAREELKKNGVTKKYDAHVWMYVCSRDELGLEVAEHERRAADRYWQSKAKAAA
jgi:hypothetical protein